MHARVGQSIFDAIVEAAGGGVVPTRPTPPEPLIPKPRPAPKPGTVIEVVPRSPAIVNWQNLLLNYGFLPRSTPFQPNPITGFEDAETIEATKRFEGTYRLPLTGRFQPAYVDIITRKVAASESGVTGAPSPSPSPPTGTRAILSKIVTAAIIALPLGVAYGLTRKST
jgi:peptidoglycan hydrolase-like protein with peptidoglycan-binding domain